MIESANENLNLLNLYMDLEAQKIRALSEALQTNPDPPLKLFLPLPNFQSSLDSYSSEIKSLTKTLQSLKESNNILQSSLNQAKSIKDKKHANFQSTLKEITQQKTSKEKELHDINQKLQHIAKDIERITKENTDKDKEIGSLSSKLDILNPPDLETVGLTSEWQYLEGKAIEYETISPKYVDDYEEAGESIDDYQKYLIRKPENIEYVLGIPQADNPIYQKTHENYQIKLEESEKSSDSDRKGWEAEDFDEDFNNDMEEIVVEEEQKILEYEEKPEDEKNTDFDMGDTEKPSVVVDFVSESYDMQGSDTRILAGFFSDKIEVVEEVKEVMEKEQKTPENEVNVCEEEEEEGSENKENIEEGVDAPCEWRFDENYLEIQEGFGKGEDFYSDKLEAVDKDKIVEEKNFTSWEVRFGDEDLDKIEKVGFSYEEKVEEFDNKERFEKEQKYDEKDREEKCEGEIEETEKQIEQIVKDKITEQIVKEEKNEFIEKEENTLMEKVEKNLKTEIEETLEKKEANENEKITLNVEIEEKTEKKENTEEYKVSEKVVEEIKKVEVKEAANKVEPPPPKKFFTKYQPKALPKKLQVKKTTDDAFFQELL
ncbi:hypothetical protein SteCoe_4067 [Stentor coeruleus]|uniref:Uncharacterized protein n=1 Tax=Stentor coeruleus TaxID=5963 RepID=A0A1R2CVF3_9CILI|nr:hypothetical protein SteCoe_4067 [Stentor coeruleus]